MQKKAVFGKRFVAVNANMRKNDLKSIAQSFTSRNWAGGWRIITTKEKRRRKITKTEVEIN